MVVIKRYSHGKYVMLTLENGNRILEHRFISESYLGRKLSTEEVVHHKDHNGKNNNPSNLVVMSADNHRKLHGQEARVFENVVCPQCNKSFNKSPRTMRYYRKKGYVAFCSRKCSGSYNSRKYWRVF